MKTFKQFVTEAERTGVAILPGGFKPPHKGHFEALRHIVNQNNAAAAIYLQAHSMYRQKYLEFMKVQPGPGPQQQQQQPHQPQQRQQTRQRLLRLRWGDGDLDG